ncbi:hypothetical protein HID58_062823, partial [Brassica napus]
MDQKLLKSLQGFLKYKHRTAVFPMNFRDDSDVELVEVGSQNEMGKAPQCSWSPVPPFQLRREPVQDLTTNSDITSRHVEGKRVLDTTVWNLLNFYAYVEYHIKCSRGYIQRRMRKGMDSLAKLLNNTSLEKVPQKCIFSSSRFASYKRFLTFCINKMEDANTLIKKLVKVQKGKLMMK